MQSTHSCSILLLFAAVLSWNGLAQDVDVRVDAPTSGIQVNLRGEALSVSYAGVNLITVGQFYFDKPGWGELHKVKPIKAKQSREGDLHRAQLQGMAKGIASYGLKLSWSHDRLEIEFDYDIVPESNVGFAVSDLFLNKELFIDTPRSALQGETGGDFNAFGPVDKLSFKTSLGNVTWQFTSERLDAPDRPSRWVLRDARSQKWRSDAMKTFSFLNVLKRSPGVPARQKLRVIVEIRPRAYLACAVEAHGILNALDKLSKRSPALEAVIAANARIADVRGTLRDIVESRQSDPAVLGRTLARGRDQLKSLIARDRMAAPSPTGRPVVIPEPQKMSVGQGEFTVDAGTVIVVPAAATAEEMRGPTVLQEELLEYFGVDVPVLRADVVPPNTRGIVVGTSGNCPLADRIARKLGLKITPEDPGPEGYVLGVTANEITIVGSDVRGAFYGVQTLIQLLRRDDATRAISIPCLTIRDWPEMKIRGMMLIPTAHMDLAYFKRAIRRIIARHKLNTIIIGEASMGFIRWDSHPEIAREGACTPAQLRECAEFAREHFLDIIPLVQCWGHCQYILPKRPDLAEVSGGKKSSALCLTKPEVKTFLTDIYAEAIDIFQPRIFHIGGDEAQPIAQCESCKGIAPDKLVADHITFLHDWLAKRNIKTMMWHDMLVEHEKWPGMRPANSGNPTYGGAITHPAVDALPRDIIMAVWIYKAYKTYPPIQYFQDLGFPVVTCPWFNEKNNFSLAVETQKAGALGFIGTSWMFSTVRNLNMMSMLSLEYAWTPGTPTLDKLPYLPKRRIQQAMLPPLPSMTSARMTPVDLRAWCNRTFRDDVAGDAKGWLDLGPLADMRLLPDGRVKLEGVPFDILTANSGEQRQCTGVAGKDTELGMPAEITGIRVGRRVKGLVFLHTSTYVTGARNFAEYVVRFADGSEEHIPLSELRNIAPLTKPTNFTRWFKRPMYSGYTTDSIRAWTGMNLGGEEIDLQTFEWINPHPDREIAEFDLRILNHSKNAAVLLLALTAVE